MSDQLRNLGLVTEASARVHEAQETLDGEEAQRQSLINVSSTADELETCGTMEEFKRIAKEALLRDIGRIHSIVPKAHRFKDDANPAAKEFIRFFYVLRGRITETPRHLHVQLIKRAFRRRNPTFEVSDRS